MSRTGRSDRAVDLALCLVAAGLGAVFLSPVLRDPAGPLSDGQVLADVAAGVLACGALWTRRRWPLATALLCLLLGTWSISATAAALLALGSLAVHRPARHAVAVTALWVPSSLVFAAYSSTTGVDVVLRVLPLALAATAWGMFLRARRQVLLALQERALRAEAEQQLHEDRVRLAERTRIAREMHDVLAHRISLLALHAGALEVRRDLPDDEVRATARLLRETARTALEELRDVIGVLRDGGPSAIPSGPQPTLSDLHRLVEEKRRAGTRVDFSMDVEDADAVPLGLGRDVYRIVQEALTNVAKHAAGAPARVHVSGRADDGVLVSVRNAQAAGASGLPGSGTGLLGLRERVDLAGGTLVHGPDGSGDFVVEAELRCRP